MNWKIITLAASIGLAGCSVSNPFSSGKSSAAPAGSSSSAASSAQSPAAAASRSGMVSGNQNNAGDCNANAVQGAIGKTLNQAMLDQLRAQSGAGSARTLSPREMITMEYNPARLNVLIDNNNVVTAARCG